MKKLRYYFLILNFLQRNTYPRREVLLEYLKQYNVDISERTLYRALKEFETEFGITIKLCNEKKGYFISEQHQGVAHFVHNGLKNLAITDILGQQTSKAIQGLSESAMDRNTTVPIENLKVLLEAIKVNKKIEFTYLSASKKVVSKYMVAPLFVTQHNGVWHLVAKGQDKTKTFEIEKITNVKQLELKFRECSKKALKNYNQSLGFGYCNEKPEEVELCFDRELEAYLISNPIHESQNSFLCKESGEFIVTLNVRINKEFKQEVLKYTNQVKVNKPSWLKNDIVKSLQGALQNHSMV